MSPSKLALSAFGSGFNCSQAILAAYGSEYGLDRQSCLRLACCFGGGMGQAETCGAVTGSLMVLGLEYGPEGLEDTDRKTAMASSISFLQQFRDRCGSIRCRELLDCDISTEEGLQQAKEQQLFTTKCPQLIAAAAEILDILRTRS